MIIPDFLYIGLGFLEGLALIVSPCILPILPIILASSLEGSKKRPFGIVIGFVLAFSFFTFFSRALVRFSGIDLSVIQYASYVLLLLLGVVMLSTYLANFFAKLTQRLANIGNSLTAVNDTRDGFYSGVVVGGLIGLIWTPCAGPILAAVIVQTVIQQTTWNSFFVVLAFGLGAAIPMLLIALLGRKMMTRLSFFKKRAILFRKILGVVIILSVGYMMYGIALPFSSTSSATNNQGKLVDGLYRSYQAPAVGGIVDWINSPPLSIEQLKGKVVLIDFWTYSCINCVRTFPYLKDWYAKYHSHGFEIIGVHSPEFEFEKNLNNVKKAVEKYGIKYPVALDNNFVTWRNYNNSYWPAHYLIARNGQVVYQHFGEGEYATTENNIRFLLGLEGETIAEKREESSFAQTPETYLGYARMGNYASPEAILHNKMATYSFPASLPDNQWALQGAWIVTPENIISAGENSALKIHFNARKVFVVMGNATRQPIRVKLSLNGEAVLREKGKDVRDSAMTVERDGLYEAIVLPRVSGGILQLNASAPGLMVYTFTFGG